MKHIVPAPPIAVGEVDFTTEMLIRWLVSESPAFNTTARGLHAGAKVLAALEAERVNGAIPMEDADHDVLAAAAQNPGQDRVQLAYPIKPATALIPHVDAIVNATSKPPKAEEPEPARPSRKRRKPS